MKKPARFLRLLSLLLLAFAPSPIFRLPSPLYGEIHLPESGANLTNPKIRDFLQSQGASYSLSANERGQIIYEKWDPQAKKAKPVALSKDAGQQLLNFLSKVPADRAETAMADALMLFLKPHLARQDPKIQSLLFTQDSQGNPILTAAGRTLLMDILTAEDGVLWTQQNSQQRPRPASSAMTSYELLASMQKTGMVTVNGLASGGSLEAAAGKLKKSYDGSIIQQNTYQISPFDWQTGDGVLFQQRNALGLQSLGIDSSNLKSGDNLRILVAAKQPVRMDRYLVKDQRESGQIYKEAGLKEDVLSRHKAKLVRAIDNLIALDVPVSEAPKLGQELAKEGILSRPARILSLPPVRLAADALRTGPRWPDPMYQFGPIFKSEQKDLDQSRIGLLNAESKDLLKVSALWAKGMTGKGAIIGIIDTGADADHPDLKDRILLYLDFTEGNKGGKTKEDSPSPKDRQGHGTHVAGSVAGSGKASDGLYKGMAPDSKLVIAKVFGDKGDATEDAVLASMKALRNLPKEARPQVVNMSLGGPGDPENDPLNKMANEMMIKDNIVMTISAGNSGPKKWTVSSPGNALHVITVTGVDKAGRVPFFPSRGPIKTKGGKIYNKPDIAAVAGGVNMEARERNKSLWERIRGGLIGTGPAGLSAGRLQEVPEKPEQCFYTPGVISTRSSDDPETDCDLKGNPRYRFMSGTSMADPMAAGVSGIIVGEALAKPGSYKSSAVKALLMETATDLGEKPEVQGAGLINGEKISQTVRERLEAGVPIGNIAFMLSKNLSPWETANFDLVYEEYEITPVGILHKKTGHLINDDKSLRKFTQMIEQRYNGLPAWEKARRWYNDFRGVPPRWMPINPS